jgi:hypothetical protein
MLVLKNHLLLEIWCSHSGEDVDVGLRTDLQEDNTISDKHTISMFRPEDGENMFLRNAGM